MNITQEKSNIINKLTVFNQNLQRIGEDFQIDWSDLSTKINQVVNNIQNDVFSIAFFGAFSDGKSTILSVLIDKLDIEISPKPTTDVIQTYKFHDYQIIDTPGLFSENQLHDDLTKKYISEANIVIYTVDPVNPLKDSHQSVVKWLFSDLKKHDSTIFVINKMDEVADLEDDKDFERNASIKKEVVSKVIKDITGYEDASKIICVAADPFQQGLDYWANNKDYKKLSRIEDLEDKISEFNESYKAELLVRAGVSLMRDASLQIIPELETIRNYLVKEVNVLTNQIDEIDNRRSILSQDISRSYIRIKEDFLSLRDDVLLAMDATSNGSELAQVLQAKVGDEYYLLEERIDLIIKNQTDGLLAESKQFLLSVEESLSFHEKMQEQFLCELSQKGKLLVKGLLAAPTRQIADGVLKTRNFLKIPFKFKPYGALKFAKILKGLPLVFEVLDMAIKVAGKAHMDKKRSDVKTSLETVFKALIQSFTEESYMNTSFPCIAKSNNLLVSFTNSKQDMETAILKIDKIIDEINVNL